VLADKRACELYGGKTFSRGLKRVALNDSVFTEIVEKHYVPELLKNQQLFISFSKAMDLAYDKSNEGVVKNLEEGILKSRGDETLSSHPKIQTRMEYADKLKIKVPKGIGKR